jgi:hypothetical protein
VIGYDDRIHPDIDRARGIVRAQDAFDYQRKVGAPAEAGEIVPAQRRIAEDLDEASNRGRGVFRRAAREFGTEGGIAEVVGDPVAVEKRRIGVREVALAPGQDGAVHRHHDRAVAGPFRPRDEAGGHIRVGAPVELKPTRCITHRGGHILEGDRGSAAQDDRNPQPGGGSGGSQLAFGMENALHADWCEEDGRGKRGSEQRALPLAAGKVAEYPRLDSPAAKRGEIGSHGIFGPRAAGEIAERVGAQQLPGALLERFRGHRHLRPTLIDLDLTGDAERPGSGAGHGPSLSGGLPGQQRNSAGGPSPGGARTASCRGGLELPGLARLHVIPLAAEVLEQARLLHLALECLERPVEPIILVELHFYHGPHRHGLSGRENGRFDPSRPAVAIRAEKYGPAGYGPPDRYGR